MYIKIKCKYCGCWYEVNTGTCEAWRLQCCNIKCVDNYFLVTGCGFNLRFNQQEILKINSRISLHPAHELIETHFNKGGFKSEV